MRWFAVVLLVLTVCATARGESGDDRLQVWRRAMGELTAALVGEDAGAVANMLEGVPLRSFDPAAKPAAADLFDQCTVALPISARAYLGPPAQAASDIGEDFAATDLPETIKQKFTFPDTAAARTANQVAGRWISESLKIHDDTFVGLIVLWRGNRSLPALDDNPLRHVVFVLVTGTSPDQAAPRLTQIIYGNPLPR